MWLAEVGKERVDEIIDPELSMDRALQTYIQKEGGKVDTNPLNVKRLL